MNSIPILNPPVNKKKANAIGKGLNGEIIFMAIVLTSYFYCLPLGRYAVAGVDSDFRIYDIAFIAFLIIFGLRRLSYFQYTKEYNKKKLYKLSLIFLMLVWFSLTLTGLISGLNTLLAGILRAYRFTMYFLIAGFILLIVDTPQKQRFLLTVLYINIIMQMALSIGQSMGFISNLWPDYWIAGYGILPVGTLSPHHKHIGTVMLLGISLSLGFLQYKKSLSRWLFIIPIMVGMIAVSILAVSRTAWLGLAGIFIAFLYKNRTSGLLFLGIVVFILLILLFSVPDVFRTDLQESVQRVFTDRLERMGIEGIAGERMNVYDNIPEAIYYAPWIILIGTGFQNIGHYLGATGAHNNYLQVWFELGIIGFVVYMLLLWRISKTLNYSEFLAKDKYEKSMANAIWAGFVGILFTMLVGETLWAQYSMFTLSGQILAVIALACCPINWNYNNRAKEHGKD